MHRHAVPPALLFVEFAPPIAAAVFLATRRPKRGVVTAAASRPPSPGNIPATQTRTPDTQGRA